MLMVKATELPLQLPVSCFASSLFSKGTEGSPCQETLSCLFLTQSQSSSFPTHAKHVSEVEMNSGSLAATRSRLFSQCVLMEPTAQPQGVALDRSKHSLPKRRRFRNVSPRQKEGRGERQVRRCILSSTNNKRSG